MSDTANSFLSKSSPLDCKRFGEMGKLPEGNENPKNSNVELDMTLKDNMAESPCSTPVAHLHPHKQTPTPMTMTPHPSPMKLSTPLRSPYQYFRSPRRMEISGENIPITDPLEMSEILENLFKFAELSDVKNFRLVCHIWNREACRTLQKYSYVYLRESEKYEEELEHFLNMLEAKRNEHVSVNVNLNQILNNSVTCATASPSALSKSPRAIENPTSPASSLENSLHQYQNETQQQEQEQLTKLPSPFRKYYLKANLLSSKNIERIIQDPDIQIFRLRLTATPSLSISGNPEYENDLFQKNLYRLLKKNAPFLTRFNVILKEGINLQWNPKGQDVTSEVNMSKSESLSLSKEQAEEGEIEEKTLTSDCDLQLDLDFIQSQNEPIDLPLKPLNFPSLKELEIDEADSGRKSPHSLDFLVSIISGAPNLKRLYFNGMDDDLVISVIKKTHDILASTLKEIHLKTFTPKILQTLTHQVKWPLLTYLNIDDRLRSESETVFGSETLQRLIKNFSSSLEDLSIYWPSSTPDISFPLCPKLERLCIEGYNGSLGQFNKNRLPALKHLIVYDIEVSDSILDPHDGVQSLELESDFRNEPFDFEVDEENCYFLEYISIQYPNLDALYLTCSVSTDMMFTIIRHLSQLSVLDIITESGFCEIVFTGLNKHMLERAILIDQLDAEAVSKLPRTNCLLDLKKLKTLSLLGFDRDCVRNIGITNNGIQFGLARIPSLGYLRINWTPELSPVVVSSSLNRINKLVVNNPDFKPTEQLMELWELMPQVVFEPSNPYFK